MTDELLRNALDFCSRDGVDLLIANCRTTERRTIQRMEESGFRLMDAIVCFELDLTKPFPPPGSISIRPANVGEEDRLAEVAVRAFQGYSSHYHADPRLDPARCEEAYPDWVRRSCRERGERSEVIVAEVEHEPVGFVLMRVQGERETISPLAAVLPEHRRGKVIYSLAVRVFEWSISKGAERTFAMIQLDNIPMQRAMLKMGFEPSYSYYTFHKWFDR